MYTILSKTFLSPTVARFEIHAPYVARKRQAGNFVILRVSPNGERIPITIVDSDLDSGSITLIVQAIGKTTKALLRMQEGEELTDLVGPLGKPTPLHTGERIVCIGGGVGTAELFPITAALHRSENKITSIIGARSQDLIILEPEMRSVSDELFIVTDDGSYGRKGIVTDQLDDILKQAPVDVVYAIGPLPMMKAVSELTRRYGVRTIVSVNALMVDGTGMCGGCRVTVGGEMKFACVDGPEFDGHKVDFDELLIRSRSYRKQEIESDRRAEDALKCASQTAGVSS